MSDDHNPLAEIGGNDPPTDAQLLALKLEQDHAELIAACAAVEIAAMALPEAPATDEECAAITELVAKAKAAVKKAEKTHTAEKEPFLSQGRVVDGFFKGLWTPLEATIKANEARINAYMRAKAEKERQERLAAAREQERIAQEAAAEKERLEAEARAAERRAEEAAEAIRKAATPEARQEAAAEMNAAEQEGVAARAGAEDSAKEAAQAERIGEAHERAAGGSVGKLGKVTTGGAGTAHTTFWNHRIKDADALVASLGPLGRHLTNDAIMSAIAAAKREAIAANTIEHFSIPGVEFFEDSRTTVRQARA